tara:strand:+ start:306 stop:503 length:198 start_codon:yes stop_codon:yes gene_type:complete
MNHMVDSDPNWLDDLYKYDNVTFLSDCCGAYPIGEVEIVDDIATGRCSKCKDGTGFHDEKDNKYY